MILEALVTTRNADGTPHLAPMGPHVEAAEFDRFELRPYATSQTHHNLLRSREGVLHVTDDALLLARAAVAAIETFPPYHAAKEVAGFVLNDCCRSLEFRISEIEASEERVRMTAEVVHREMGRAWFGFNRAKHAVVEAAILATRVHLLPADQIDAEFQVFERIVGKTGGADEREAMAVLRQHLRHSRKSREEEPGA